MAGDERNEGTGSGSWLDAASWAAPTADRPRSANRTDERAALVEATKGRADALAGLLGRHAAEAWRFAAVGLLDRYRATDAVVDAFVDVVAEHRDVLAAPRPFRAEVLRRVQAAVAFSGARDVSKPAIDVDLTQPSALPFRPAADPSYVTSAFALLGAGDRELVWLDGVERVDEATLRDVLGTSTMAVRGRTGQIHAAWRRSAIDAQVQSTTGRCRAAAERLGAYLDHTLERLDVDRLHAHVAGCVDCTARLEAVEDPVLHLVAAVSAPPDDLVEVVTSHLREPLRTAHFG